MSDDDFEIKPGKSRQPKGDRLSPYVRRITREVSRHRILNAGNATGIPSRRYRFTGSRIGRGQSAGAIAASGAGQRSGRRRVVVRVRLVRAGSKGAGKGRTHLNYLKREGVSREGKAGQFYDAHSDEVSGKDFLTRCEGDRHQFRLIISPEDGEQLADLKPFIRDLMQQMEQDLETRLEWIAVDHHDTGHPHTHIVLRGVDECGKDLIITRDYLGHGIRARAEHLVTLELGPETEQDLKAKREQEINALRYTRLDRTIIQHAEQNAGLNIGPMGREQTQQAAGELVFSLSQITKPEKSELTSDHQSMILRRLKTLEQLGLVHKATEAGSWTIKPHLEATLRQMERRTEIIHTITRDLKRAGYDQTQSMSNQPMPAPQRYHILESNRAGQSITGRLISSGFADEATEQGYLLLESLGGQICYAETGPPKQGELVRAGMILQLKTRETKTREVDQTIAAIASRNDGLYSREAHKLYDPKTSEKFIETHIRRLEALRRQGSVTRFRSGTWEIGADYLERVNEYEAGLRGKQPIEVNILSPLPLAKQITRDGWTWLDQQIMEQVKTGQPVSALSGPATGFGKEVQVAIAQRQSWLMEQGLAREQGGQFKIQRGWSDILQQRELNRAGQRLSRDLKLPFTPVQQGEPISGIYRRSVQLSSGRFAVIERGADFTLVPWRPVLERARDKTVSGVMNGKSISWTMTRRKGIEREF